MCLHLHYFGVQSASVLMLRLPAKPAAVHAATSWSMHHVRRLAVPALNRPLPPCAAVAAVPPLRVRGALQGEQLPMHREQRKHQLLRKGRCNLCCDVLCCTVSCTRAVLPAARHAPLMPHHRAWPRPRPAVLHGCRVEWRGLDAPIQAPLCCSSAAATRRCVATGSTRTEAAASVAPLLHRYARCWLLPVWHRCATMPLCSVSSFPSNACAPASRRVRCGAARCRAPAERRAGSATQTSAR